VAIVATTWEKELRVFDVHGNTEVMSLATKLFMETFDVSKFKFEDFFYIFQLCPDMTPVGLQLYAKRCRYTYDVTRLSATDIALYFKKSG